MMFTSCQKIKAEYEKLKNLKQEFFIAYERALKTGDLAEIKKLKQPLAKAMAALKEKMAVSVERAREILGKKNVLGPEEVSRTWGMLLEKVPDIPFSRERLKNAAKMNMMLVLRVDKTAEGQPLSIAAMYDILAGTAEKPGKWLREGKSVLIEDISTSKKWYGASFTKDAPRFGWALVSKDILPKSTDKNYVEQTEQIVNVLKKQMFEGMNLPEAYASAIAEFEFQKFNLAELAENDWPKASQKISELKITQLTRSSMPETIYDLAVFYDANNERLLSAAYNWTLSLKQPEYLLVAVGKFQGWGQGVQKISFLPNGRDGALGVCLSFSV